MPSTESSPRILRIPRSDDPQGYVLLHVSQAGSSVLDLNIAATEGENPYTGTVRQDRLKNLRVKNYQGGDDEWAQIVSYIFGQLEEASGKSDWLSGIESSANIIGSDDEDKEIVITIRKRIQAITQRLGSVTLKQDDEQAIQLFEWSGVAVARADDLERLFSSLADRYRVAEETISQLNKQLQEFISAKSQHEEQLMANFVQLLNEKKLKIRNQQRLLASAKVDPEKVSEMQAATSGRNRRPTEKSKKGKRRANEINNESESEDGFEKMEIDPIPDAEDKETDDEQPSTPQPLEEEDNTTTDGEFSPPTITKGREGDIPEVNRDASSNRPMIKEPAPPPPRRELPFTKRTRANPETPQASSHPREENSAEETAGETDDDEL